MGKDRMERKGEGKGRKREEETGRGGECPQPLTSFAAHGHDTV